MKTAKKLLHLLVAITTVFYTLATAMLAVPFAANAAEPTSIGYNGRLFNSSGTALSGTYDFRFNLYTASSGGSATTSNIDVSDITVTSGFFTLSIPLGTDIGDLATASYLEIQVKADAASSYETMSTRVEILKSPYAVFAQAIENLAAASEPAANVSFSGRMYYDTTNNQLKVYRGGAWTTIASSMDDTYNNDTGERTVAVDDGDVSFDLSGTANFTIDTTTGTGDILFQDAGATWLTFSDGQAITAAGSGAISLSSGAASNFTTTAGDLSLVSSAASVVIRGVEGVADAILLDADNSAAGGIDMDAGTGGATLDTTGAFSIDGATASNVTVTGSAASLTLSVAGGGAQSVVLTSAGTGANAIDINATAGGFDVDAAGAATIDAAGASNFTTSTGSLTLSTSAGGTSSSVILRSVDTSSDAIYLDADGGAGSGVYLDAYDATNNTTGAITADAAYIQLNTFAATGPGSAGLDVNVSGANATLSMSTSDGAVSIDGGGSSGSVNLTSAQSDIVLDTQTASRNITIGNTAVARTINIGTGAGADVVNLGTGADQFNFVSTETTNDIVDVTFDSMTTANAFDISLDALSSGTGINIDSTAAWSGNLIKLDNTGNAIWSGNMISATTGTGAATGDLMNLAVEAGATGAQALVVTNAAVISNDLISISSTGAVTGDGIDGLSLAFATGNGADVTNAAQRISLTSGGTAGTDIAKGLLIDLTSTAGGTDTAIDIENTAAWDFDLDLQNDLTISNADNNDLSIVENSVTLNLDFAETTAATIEYSSASSLDFVSSANANDAININASAGGIDISSASGTDGEDIDITSTGTTGEIRVTTASTTADAFRLNASAGGIDIDSNNSTFNITNTADGAGDNLTIAQAGAFSSGLILSSTGTTATAIVMSTSAGGIDITVAGAAAGENLDLLSNEGITIASTKAMATGVLIYGNAEGGGVRIQGGDTLATAISNGNDIELLTEDDIFIRATDDVSISTLSTGGVIDIASPGFNDVSSTHTINIGGVNADATDTINIATDATQGDVITIGNSTASTTIAITGGNDWSVTVGGTATFRLGHAGATSAVCHTNNAIEVAVISDCDGGASADYAERYPTAEGVGYGDIVVPGSKMVTTRDNSQGEQQIAQAVLSSEAYQGPVYGVVSNNYGDFTSAGNNVPESENPMSVALVGRVPVKVTDENGSIVVGDFLATSSTPGRAMKATQAGRVIGMALADWNGEKDTVMVQVINTWYQPPASQANDLQGGDASITNVTNVNQVVASDGNFAGSVTVAEHLYGSRDMAGRVRIKAGDDKVRVTFEKEYAHLPIVTFSLRSDELVPGRVWVSDEDTTGFTINHSAGSTTSYDLEFNWIAVGVEDAIVTISDGTTEDLTVTVLPTVEPEAPAVEESVAPESTVEPEAPAVEESVAPESTVEPEAPAVEESVAPESAQDSPAGETAG